MTDKKAVKKEEQQDLLVNKDSDLKALQDKVNALEVVIAKMAHNAGIPNSLFIENGLKHYELKAKDLKKYA
jgi:hypothetical protein